MRDPLAVPEGELLTHSPRAAVVSKTYQTADRLSPLRSDRAWALSSGGRGPFEPRRAQRPGAASPIRMPGCGSGATCGLGRSLPSAEGGPDRTPSPSCRPSSPHAVLARVVLSAAARDSPSPGDRLDMDSRPSHPASASACPREFRSCFDATARPGIPARPSRCRFSSDSAARRPSARARADCSIRREVAGSTCASARRPWQARAKGARDARSWPDSVRAAAAWPGPAFLRQAV
jgi:hypothetical protein